MTAIKDAMLDRLVMVTRKYATVPEALAVVADARQHQVEVAWKDVAEPDAGGRSSEEWLLLLNHYITKVNAVYTESDGSTVEGRARMTKYAGILANIALWYVQATAGLSNADKAAHAPVQPFSGAVHDDMETLPILTEETLGPFVRKRLVTGSGDFE